MGDHIGGYRSYIGFRVQGLGSQLLGYMGDHIGDY